jgi:DNA-binding transcriptional MerR regulator
MDLLSIGKMARLNNVSEQTLRLYDRIGLLKPYSIDDSTRYRYYSINQSAKLDIIQYMKGLGIPLKDIKRQLESCDISIVEKVLENQKNFIDKKILELNQMRNAVNRSLESYRRYSSSPKEGTVILEYIPQRRIYCYDSKINIYDHGLENYEYILRELRSHIILNRLPTIYFCNVGSILRKDLLESEKFFSTEIFLFIDEDFNADKGIEIIPSAAYACIYCDGFYKEKDYARKLIKHVKDNGYKIIGDYICEVVAELPVFPENERNMFIKLQIPIEF